MDMRVLIAIALAVGASGARSQMAELSDKEIAEKWMQLSIMASGESEAAGANHLKHHGISDDGAVALTRYMSQAEAEFTRVASSLRVKVCKSQQALREGGQEFLAQFVETHVSEENEIRREQVNAAESLLSEQDRLHLHDLLTNREHHGPKVGIQDAGNKSTVSLMRTGMITVEDAIKRSDCGSIEGNE